MELRFGKHKGKDLAEVPLDYLYWLNEQPWLYESVRAAVDAEIGHRQWQRQWEDAFRARERVRAAVPAPRQVDPWAAGEIVRTGYRTCAGSWHPDRGGDGEVMTRINGARDWLATLVRALPAESTD